MAKAAAKTLIASVDLKAPVDILIAPHRLDPRAHELKTKQVLEIPVGGAALFTLAERMTRSPIRLVSNFILNQTDAPLTQEVVILIDNTGPDGFFLSKDTVVATCVVVSPK